MPDFQAPLPPRTENLLTYPRQSVPICRTAEKDEKREKNPLIHDVASVDRFPWLPSPATLVEPGFANALGQVIDELYEIAPPSPSPRRGSDAHHASPPTPAAAPSQPQLARHHDDTFRDRTG